MLIGRCYWGIKLCQKFSEKVFTEQRYARYSGAPLTHIGRVGLPCKLSAF